MSGRDRDPMRELLGIQRRMNQLLESALARTDFETHAAVDTWSPVADCWQTGEALVVHLELPGLTLQDIDLRIEGDELVVEGERTLGRERAEERFHRVERAYGKFSRRFHLPSHVDRQAVEASYRQGVLRVVLPSASGPDRDPIKVSIH